MYTLFVPLFLLGLLSVPVLIISGLVYLVNESREARLTAMWSGIILGASVIIGFGVFLLTAQ